MNNLHGIHNVSTGEWIEIAYRIIMMCYIDYSIVSHPQSMYTQRCINQKKNLQDLCKQHPLPQHVLFWGSCSEPNS